MFLVQAIRLAYPMWTEQLPYPISKTPPASGQSYISPWHMKQKDNGDWKLTETLQFLVFASHNLYINEISDISAKKIFTRIFVHRRFIWKV